MLFAVISIFANFGILWYHWTTPPHPKFHVLARSRLFIRAHLVSGTINVVLPIVAFCTTDKDLMTVIMWITVGFDFVHLLTVIAQTPNVNGQRNLIVPAYQFISLIKLVSVSGLIWALLKDNPKLYQVEKLEWLWTVWANHQTYAWVRVWIMVLHLCQACRESRYTVSVLIAGTIGAGQAYGFTVMLALLFWVITYHFVLSSRTYRLIALYHHGKNKRTVRENAEMQCELHAMLQYFHESHQCLYHDVRYKSRVAAAQQILMERGYAKLSKNKQGESILKYAPISSIPHDVQALCVFKTVDVDDSGQLDLIELAQLFISNGVSIDQTSQMCELAFDQFDIDDDGLISLDEFTKAFKPYYLYQFNDLHYLMREAPKLLKNVINAPLHQQYSTSRCPFASIPMDYDSAFLTWTDLVRHKNSRKINRAASKLKLEKIVDDLSLSRSLSRVTSHVQRSLSGLQRSESIVTRHLSHKN